MSKLPRVAQDSFCCELDAWGGGVQCWEALCPQGQACDLLRRHCLFLRAGSPAGEGRPLEHALVLEPLHSQGLKVPDCPAAEPLAFPAVVHGQTTGTTGWGA